MRSASGRIGWPLFVAILAGMAVLCVSSPAFGQGGEPQYFAIRGAKVVPVSGPPIEDATVVVARGVILAVGKDVTIPADAWVIEGKGLSLTRSTVARFFFFGVGLLRAHPSVSLREHDRWRLRVHPGRSVPCRIIVAVLPTNHLFGHFRP